MPAESEKNACFFIVLSTSIPPSDMDGINQTNRAIPFLAGLRIAPGVSQPGAIEDITPGGIDQSNY